MTFLTKRLTVMDVSPSRPFFSPKVSVNEIFPVNATIFSEQKAHKLFASVILFDKDKNPLKTMPMEEVNPGLDAYRGFMSVDKEGDYFFAINVYVDTYKTWLAIAEIKISAYQDQEVVLAEGVQLLKRLKKEITNSAVSAASAKDAKGAAGAGGGSDEVSEANSAGKKGAASAAKAAGAAKAASATGKKSTTIPAVATTTAKDTKLKKSLKVIDSVIKAVGKKNLDYTDRFAYFKDEQLLAVIAKNPIKDFETLSEYFPLECGRTLSAFSAWYQFFPRSIGAEIKKNGSIRRGTFKKAASHLEYVKDMGFDIVYLGPIHPIGTSNRKGKNNAVKARQGDVGSPWAIGTKDGGHDKVDSLLGTLNTFKSFVQKARRLGLEVSIDIALQTSPDHPWVTEHPNWYTQRPDGTIQYAENPPKKYQDVYPLNFDNDPDGLVAEIIRITEVWIDAGVTVFRVDNPHTKPLWIWEHIISDIKSRHPEIIFLAEAFTKPPMMFALGLSGFDQSHSYFPWRNTKEELEEYLEEVSSDKSFYLRSTFWPSTPDILTDYLVNGGRAGHAVRAVLAAMGSPSWGIYSGFEFIENVQRDGAEEHINSEKYEIKVRDYSKVDEFGISILLHKLNVIRKEHKALQTFHNLTVHKTNNPSLLCFSKRVPAVLNDASNLEKDDTVIVVVNIDPHNDQGGQIEIDMKALGLGEEDTFRVVDQLTGYEFYWNSNPYVYLSPYMNVAHILTVE